MAKLIVDLDVMQSTINAYNREILKFKEAKVSIIRSLASLKASGWDSQASKAWFSLLDDEWLKNIDYQIRLLEHLRDCIQYGKQEYDKVLQKQDRLDNCLD